MRILYSTLPTLSHSKASWGTRFSTATLTLFSKPISWTVCALQHLASPMLKGLYDKMSKEGKPVDYAKYGSPLSPQTVKQLNTPLQHRQITFKNRLVKAGITDGLSNVKGDPTPAIIQAYTRYASGGYGMIISSDTSVDRRCRLPGATGHTPIFDAQSNLTDYTALAKAMKKEGSAAILQLTHPGPIVFFSDPAFAPSSLLADNPRGVWSQFASRLSEAEVSAIFNMFLQSAQLAEKCAFDGIQIVASNHYLPSLFLNPRLNQREDRWKKEAFVLELLKQLLAQRKNPQFLIGMKINAADLRSAGLSVQQAADLTIKIGKLGIDFLEIGGGNCQSLFEKPGSDSDSREGYFTQFFKKIIAANLSIPLMTAGEWKDPRLMNRAVAQHSNLLIGLGRPVCIDPEVGKKLLNGEISKIPSWFQEYMPPFVQGKKELAHSIEHVWHALAVAKIARENRANVVGIFDNPLYALAIRIHMMIRAILPRTLLSSYFAQHPFGVGGHHD